MGANERFISFSMEWGWGERGRGGCEKREGGREGEREREKENKQLSWEDWS